MMPYDRTKSLYVLNDEHYEFAAKHCIGKKVLDVGCGTGRLIQFLPKDIEYIGIDNTEYFVSKAKDERISFYNVMDYDGYFDTVFALGVLDSAVELKPLAEKLMSLGDMLIATFNEGKCNPKAEFKLHTREEVIDAFGDVKFYKAKTTGETYFVRRM